MAKLHRDLHKFVDNYGFLNFWVMDTFLSSSACDLEQSHT